MRLREFCVGSALMSFALITVNAGSPPDSGFETRRALGDDDAVEIRMSVPIAPAPPSLISEDKVFGAAFYDTLSILSSSNRCSDFFGGPAAADIFTQLISKVRKSYFHKSIGMRLSGSTVNIRDAATKKEYRLFDKVSINTNGPFYKEKVAIGESSIPRIGEFKPNTREVRVLMLLHELGHAVKGSNGTWLLPNDGGDEVLSRLNTQRIERACVDQIKGLGKAEATANLGIVRKMIPDRDH